MKSIRKQGIALLFVAITFIFAMSALAESDVAIRRATLYNSASLSRSIGTIPAWTSVTILRHVSGSVCKIRVSGKTGYVQTANLLAESVKYKGGGFLAKGTRVYQRPTTGSASVKIPQKLHVLIVGSKGSWTLVRTDDPDYDAIYVFVKTSKIFRR